MVLNLLKPNPWRSFHKNAIYVWENFKILKLLVYTCRLEFIPDQMAIFKLVTSLLTGDQFILCRCKTWHQLANIIGGLLLLFPSYVYQSHNIQCQYFFKSLTIEIYQSIGAKIWLILPIVSHLWCNHWLGITVCIQSLRLPFPVTSCLQTMDCVHQGH